MSINYVSKEEYDALVARLDIRRAAVAEAMRQLESAQTLADKIAAKRAIKAAQSMAFSECIAC